MSFDPLTIGTILAVAGTGVSAIGEFKSQQYQQMVAARNAEIANANAERAVQTAQVEAQDQDAITLAALGEQIASQAASGLTLRSKSFGQARKRTRALGRLDALRIRQAGDLSAYNYKTDAANFTAEANAAGSNAMAALIGGTLNTGASLMGGINKVRDPSRYTSGYPRTARLPRPRPRSLAR